MLPDTSSTSTSATSTLVGSAARAAGGSPSRRTRRGTIQRMTGLREADPPPMLRPCRVSRQTKSAARDQGSASEGSGRLRLAAPRVQDPFGITVGLRPTLEDEVAGRLEG